MWWLCAFLQITRAHPHNNFDTLRPINQFYQRPMSYRRAKVREGAEEQRGGDTFANQGGVRMEFE